MKTSVLRLEGLGLCVALGLLNALSFVDRLTLAVLGGAIRAELGLSGAAFGLLTGYAFTAVYALAATPVAELGDRWRRGGVLVGSLLVWSAAMVMSGWAGDFVDLAVSRLLLGLGEAALAPVACAMIAARVRPADQPVGMAIFVCGAPLGLLICGLWLSAAGAAIGWRQVMQALGFGGVLLALVLALPLLSQANGVSGQVATPASAKGAAARLAPLALVYGLVSTCTSGLIQWSPQVFARQLGLAVGPTALWFGLAAACAGLVGALVAPALARRGASPLAILIRGLWVSPLIAAGVLVSLTTSNAAATFAALGLALAGLAIYLPMILAAAGALAPPGQTARWCALVLLPGNLVGAGLGPLWVGLIADQGRGFWGFSAAGIGLALLAVAFAVAAMAAGAWLRVAPGARA